MTLRNNVLAILESTFAGHKDEIIKSATDRIMWQFEHQTPDAFIVNGIRYAKAADIPQTDAEITELVKEIVHKMIDNSDIAEDAYPDLKQRMHEAVERLDEYYPSENERSE